MLQSAVTQSFVIDVSGVFAGAAVRIASLHGESFRFIAVHPRVKGLDQSEWPTLDAVRDAASRLLRAGRSPGREAGS